MHGSKLVWVLDHAVSSRCSVTIAAAPLATAVNCQLATRQQPARLLVSGSASPSTLSFNSSSSSSSNSNNQRSRSSCQCCHNQTHSALCSAGTSGWSAWPAQLKRLACNAGGGSSSSSSSNGGSIQHVATQWGCQIYCFSRSSRTGGAGQGGAGSKPYHPFAAAVASSSSSSSSSEAAAAISTPRPPESTAISSPANAYIKHCVKLRESGRYRHRHRRLLLVGATLLAELAESGSSVGVLVLFVRPRAVVPPGITAQSVITVTEPVMKKLTGLEEPAGVQVVAELALPEYVNLANWQPASSPAAQTSTQQQQQQQQRQHHGQVATIVPKRLQRLLVLEGVQDPGNLGTLLRCAAAFGWDAVWLLPGCVDPFNDKALRASRGAALRWPLAAGSLPELLAVVKQHGMLLLAAHPESEDAQQQRPGSTTGRTPAAATRAGRGGGDSESLIGGEGKQHQQQQQQPPQPVCLVLGTEGAGLSDDVLAAATPLAIPMSGHMESLNVGVAGAILMFALSDGLHKLLSRLQQLGQSTPP